MRCRIHRIARQIGRQARSTAALAIKGQGNESQDQGAGLFGGSRENRADARAGATAKADHDENDIGAFA